MTLIFQKSIVLSEKMLNPDSLFQLSGLLSFFPTILYSFFFSCYLAFLHILVVFFLILLVYVIIFLIDSFQP